MSETWENDNKRNFEPDFGPFTSIFGHQNLFLSFTSTST